MKAILLAAGFGTRLLPFTNHMPKCLIPINGRPLIDYWINDLLNAGVNEIWINTHHLNNVVKKWIKNHKYRHKIIIDHESKLVGSVGTMLRASKFIGEDSFMLIHGDNLSKFNLKKFINFHENKKENILISMMTFKTNYPKSCGIVEMDTNNLLIDYHEKVESPPSNIANAAVFILEPILINYLRNLNESIIDFSADVVPQFKKKNPMLSQ